MTESPTDLRCPDCHAAVPRSSIVKQDFQGLGVFGVCPRCAVGSPLESWHAHDAADCPTIFTPIEDCEHKDAADGCCHHPKNLTPECHAGACPRLHKRLYSAWSASLVNGKVS